MNNNKPIIVHIVTKDKFSVGYINFMKLRMNEYEHYFLIPNYSCETYNENELIDLDNIYYYYGSMSLLKDRIIKEKLKIAKKIIVTGLFHSIFGLLLWKRKYMKKTFIQLWGGDFYYLREKNTGFVDGIYKISTRIILKRAFAIVFLIKEEKEAFVEVTGIEPRKFFEAPMMEDPLKDQLLFSYDENKNNIDKKIIVGNSADKSNKHKEAFELLKKELIGEKYTIVCPLSYRNEDDYANEVIIKGKEDFGDNFIAITEWFDKKRYFDLLNTCSIGVYLNDRQQALGNIYALLYMGKKVYMRAGTSMYKYLKNNGCIIFSEKDICDRNLNYRLTDEEKTINKNFIKKIYSQEYAEEKWTYILENID